MAKLEWDAIGERLYETGTKKGVLYLQTSNGYGNGIAWNGLTGFSEAPEGADPTDLYADDIKYLSIRSREDFKGTITAYTYPEEFTQCDGTASPIPGMRIGQQGRKAFGFSYVTTIGNDVDYDDFGYKIHLVYGATASPSSKDYKTINDSPEAIEFSWEITTTPTNVGTINGVEYKPTATIEIDSTKFTTTEAKAKLAALEAILYGTDSYTEFDDSAFVAGTTYYEKVGNDYVATTATTPVSGTTYYIKTGGTDARLPLPSEVYTLLTA